MRKKPPRSLSFFARIRKQLFHHPLNSKEELLQALREAEEQHIIDSHSRLIIEGTMQLENMEVRDVMVPKSKMVMLAHDASNQELLEVMINSSHSRFPVLNDNKDKVQGVLLAKDLLSYLAKDKKHEFNYKEYLRDSLLVPESKTLGALLRDFQAKKSHMATVIDEYGEIAGLVTLEDVLEQIVGEIEDEHDLEEDNIIDFGEGRYLLKGNTPIEEFEEFFTVSLQVDEVDTVAGFVIQALRACLSKWMRFHYKVLTLRC